MVNVSIARRYARALLDAAGDSARSDLIAEQLLAFVGIFEQNRELSDLVNNPAYTRSQRSRVVEALIARTPGMDQLLTNTLRLLTDRSRLGYLADIARLYRDMADAKAGRLRGHVSSAAALSTDTLERLGQRLRQITQKDVVLESRVDRSLLGGASALVGGTLYDGTLRTQLEDLRRQLKTH